MSSWAGTRPLRARPGCLVALVLSADLFPLDGSPGLGAGYRSTPYHCYTREPKGVTDVYEVRLHEVGLPVFEDERGS